MTLHVELYGTMSAQKDLHAPYRCTFSSFCC